MIPVLWLCGPPGVGKTSVAWQVYERLTVAAYVDIDQLGICFAPPSDPDRHRVKASNLAAVVNTFRMAGARAVVVSGVVDPAARPDPIPRAALTVCRLRADRDGLARRLVGRDGPAADLTAVLAEADALDTVTFADCCVDTTALSSAEVAEHVLASWPPKTAMGSARLERSASAAALDAGGVVMWVSGPTAVGKSRIGFELYTRLQRMVGRTAYIDVEQLGFCRTDRREVKVRNLAAVWASYRAVGVERLVVTGRLDDDVERMAFVEALPDTRFTVAQLHAGHDELTRRILLRGDGVGWAEPGDSLRGRPSAELRAIAAAAAEESAALLDGIDVQTDGRSVDDVVTELLHLLSGADVSRET